jgi:hypothetical protein
MRTGWRALALLALLPACHKSVRPNQLESRNNTVTAKYELHRNVDLLAFLQSQPPGSADALIMDMMPPPVIVVARVSLVSPSSQPPSYVSTFLFSDATSASKPWQAASLKPSGEYRAIFGFEREVTRVETVLTP